MNLEEWKDWREHPVTKEFFKVLLNQSLAHRKAMALGIDGISYTEIGEKYTSMKARAEIYEFLAELTAEELFEEANEDEDRQEQN